jgi:hypothetical protein
MGIPKQIFIGLASLKIHTSLIDKSPSIGFLHPGSVLLLPELLELPPALSFGSTRCVHTRKAWSRNTHHLPLYSIQKQKFTEMLIN